MNDSASPRSDLVARARKHFVAIAAASVVLTGGAAAYAATSGDGSQTAFTGSGSQDTSSSTGTSSGSGLTSSAHTPSDASSNAS